MDVFAQYVAEGLSLADAYRHAFNTANMKAKTIRDDASRLAQHSGVKAAIEAYRAEFEAQNRISALEQGDRIWGSLWALIDNSDVPPAVKVRALNLAARLCGMFNAPKDDKPVSAVDLESELGQRLHAQMR